METIKEGDVLTLKNDQKKKVLKVCGLVGKYYLFVVENAVIENCDDENTPTYIHLTKDGKNRHDVNADVIRVN